MSDSCMICTLFEQAQVCKICLGCSEWYLQRSDTGSFRLGGSLSVLLSQETENALAK